jgi:hypothetical protein
VHLLALLGDHLQRLTPVSPHVGIEIFLKEEEMLPARLGVRYRAGTDDLV